MSSAEFLSIAVVCLALFGLGVIAGLCWALIIIGRSGPDDPRPFYDVPDFPPADWEVTPLQTDPDRAAHR